MNQLDIRTAAVVQYLQPFREGGSMPALVRADDGFSYILKFRGAGQGKNALVAELLGGELARALGLKVPELVFLTLDERFGKTEPDEEIQDLLNFSVGLNIGLHYLSGAITFDPLVHKVEGLLASKIVLLDSMMSNIDRTAKNPNLLIWHQELWVIDNGSSFYFHHNWPTWEGHLQKTFPLIKDHVLLEQADQLEAAKEELLQRLTPQTIKAIIESIPQEWLENETSSMSPEAARAAYLQFLMAKREMMEVLTKEAKDARDRRL